MNADPSKLSPDEEMSGSKENAWSKPLNHSAPIPAAIVPPSVSNAPRVQVSGLPSGSSSFEHQDSGVDVSSDQPASAASSQRSSPNNDEIKKKILAAAAKSAAPIGIAIGKADPVVSLIQICVVSTN